MHVPLPPNSSSTWGCSHTSMLSAVRGSLRAVAGQGVATRANAIIARPTQAPHRPSFLGSSESSPHTRARVCV